MNTLNAEEWEEFTKNLQTAKDALNRACEILAVNWIYSPLGLQAERMTGEAHTQCSNALYAAQQEQQRLMKASQEELV